MSGEQTYSALLDSPVGMLGIRFSGGNLSGLDFLGNDTAENTERSDGSLDEVREALQEYFQSGRVSNNIKKELQGTEFQRKVWHELEAIPPGKTRTYGDIARSLKSSPRAVGNACRRNPVPIFVPCHRVVSAQGAGGFMGETSGSPMVIKRWLLEHEQNCR